MNTRFPAQPLCEQCGKEPADTFACFHDEDNKWKFVGKCCADRMVYDIPIDRFFHAPASTVDWFGQINEKTWMDWKSFVEMMERFRDATGSFNQP